MPEQFCSLEFFFHVFLFCSDMDDARVGMAYARGLAEGREQTPASKKFTFISWFLAGVLFGVVSLGAKQCKFTQQICSKMTVKHTLMLFSSSCSSKPIRKQEYTGYQNQCHF